MEHLWEAGPGDVKAVHRVLGTRRRITLNTVQSTMERLYRKGLLDREKVSHAYVYRPRQSREQFGARVVEQVIEQVLGGDTEPAFSAFVDLAARAGDDSLKRLEQLVAERRRERERRR